ncbi:MAG: ABC transporter permease, partial [Muribaculaceae bacterium]|nr:ABC transporter permease [Muribaculaceae bacterium]
MFDLATEIYQTIRNNKLRTSLTGLSVAWGIFMLIVLLSMARGVSNSFEAEVNRYGTPGIILWNGRTSTPYKGYKENRQIRMQESDLAVIKTHVGSDVSSTSASVSIDTAVISTTKDYITGGINGVYPDMQQREGITMLYGRFINDNDMKERRKVLVISKSNAEILYDDAAKAINSQVNCMGLAYTVIGVYKTENNNNNYAPFSTIIYQANDFGKVHNIR